MARIKRSVPLKLNRWNLLRGLLELRRRSADRRPVTGTYPPEILGLYFEAEAHWTEATVQAVRIFDPEEDSHLVQVEVRYTDPAGDSVVGRVAGPFSCSSVRHQMNKYWVVGERLPTWVLVHPRYPNFFEFDFALEEVLITLESGDRAAIVAAGGALGPRPTRRTKTEHPKRLGPSRFWTLEGVRQLQGDILRAAVQGERALVAEIVPPVDSQGRLDDFWAFAGLVSTLRERLSVEVALVCPGLPLGPHAINPLGCPVVATVEEAEQAVLDPSGWNRRAEAIKRYAAVLDRRPLSPPDQAALEADLIRAVSFEVHPFEPLNFHRATLEVLMADAGLADLAEDFPLDAPTFRFFPLVRLAVSLGLARQHERLRPEQRQELASMSGAANLFWFQYQLKRSLFREQEFEMNQRFDQYYQSVQAGVRERELYTERLVKALVERGILEPAPSLGLAFTKRGGQLAEQILSITEIPATYRLYKALTRNGGSLVL